MHGTTVPHPGALLLAGLDWPPKLGPSANSDGKQLVEDDGQGLSETRSSMDWQRSFYTVYRSL